MTYSFLGSSRRNLAPIGLAAAIAASACSSSTDSATSQLSNPNVARVTTYTWTYVNVNPWPNSSGTKYQTEATGINDTGEVVGFYSNTVTTNKGVATVDTSRGGLS
jgi:ABC-type glycerol-3-phosphate transport system substrate-binding protein